MVADDLLMLQDGRWVPDADSIGATLANAIKVANAVPLLLRALRLLKETAHALETPGDFDEQGLRDTRFDAGAFLELLEELENRHGH